METTTSKKRVLADDKDKRDLFIYLLWENGGLTNEEIGSYFGMTYSAVRRRIGEIRKRLKLEKEWINALASF